MNKIVIEFERCKGCSLCVAECPEKIIEIGERPNAAGMYVAQVKTMDECLACALCAMVCPDAAITVYRDWTDEAASSVQPPGRVRKE